MKHWISSILVVIGVSSAFSTELWRGDVSILGVLPISGNRPAAPFTQNFINVTISDAPWSAPTTLCSTTEILIRKEDKEIYTAVLTAYSMGQHIQIVIDDTIKPYGGTKNPCQVTYINIAPK